MASKATCIDWLLAQARNATGSLAGGTVTVYEAGTVTPATIWTDRDKGSAAANPYTLDANGTAQLYADGLIKIVIKNSAGSTVYTRDNINYVDYLTSGAYQAIDADYASLNAAIAAIGATPTTLLIRTAGFSTTGAYVVPATLSIKIEYPGSIANSTNAGTFNGPFSASLSQVFTGTGTITGLSYAYPEWFGGSISKAFAASPHVILHDGTYTIDNEVISLNAADGLTQYTLTGNGRETKLDLTNFNGDYAFLVNDDGAGNRVTNTAYHPRFVVKNLYIDGDSSTDVKFAKLNRMSIQMENVLLYHLDGGVEVIRYCDNNKFDSVYWTPRAATDYFFKVLSVDSATMGVADSLLVNQFFTGNSNAFYLDKVRGATFNSCNGGRYLITESESVVFNGGHFEFPNDQDAVGNFLIKNSTVQFNGTHIRSDNGSSNPLAITVTDDTSINQQSNVLLNQVTFRSNINDSTMGTADITWTSTNKEGSRLRMINCSFGQMRLDSSNGDAFVSADTNGFVPGIAGTFITNTSNFTALYSTDVTLQYNKRTSSPGWEIVPTNAHQTRIRTYATPTVDTIVLDTAVLASGFSNGVVYYYTAIIYGPGYIGNSGASTEVSIESDGASSNKLVMNVPPNCILRIARSTTAIGVDSEYSDDANTFRQDIPIGQGGKIVLWDRGNGFGRYLWGNHQGTIFPAATAYTGTYDIQSGIIDAVYTATPENIISAPYGSTCRNTAGGASTSFYVKEAGGGGNTGWVGK